MANGGSKNQLVRDVNPWRHGQALLAPAPQLEQLPVRAQLPSHYGPSSPYFNPYGSGPGTPYHNPYGTGPGSPYFNPGSGPSSPYFNPYGPGPGPGSPYPPPPPPYGSGPAEQGRDAYGDSFNGVRRLPSRQERLEKRRQVILASAQLVDDYLEQEQRSKILVPELEEIYPLQSESVDATELDLTPRASSLPDRSTASRSDRDEVDWTIELEGKEEPPEQAPEQAPEEPPEQAPDLQPPENLTAPSSSAQNDGLELDLDEYHQTPHFANNESLDDFLNKVTSLPVTTAAVTLNWSLDDAINAALMHSHQIHQLRIATFESLQDAGIQFGRFDTTSFFEQNFQDSNSPVGSAIDSTGTAARIKGENFDFRYGVRQELLSGGQVELSKNFGTRDDNSGILVPRDQASSGLTLSLNKELLQGAGRSIGMNEVLVATQRAEVSRFENVAQTAELLSRVSTAYWGIFSARGALIAAIENASQAQTVFTELQARKNLDANPNLLEQARVAFEQQRVSADLAYADLAKAQFELINLVNAPELLTNHERIEIIPSAVPVHDYVPPDIASRHNTAIHNRAEVRAAVESIKEAQLTHNFSLNALLPRLTFLAEVAFEGLSGDRDLPAASRNMFDSNASYQLGFNFEFPLQNRSARFTKRQAELVLARLSQQWSTAIENVKRDVLVAVQDLETNHSVVQRQSKIYESAKERLRFLDERRFRIPQKGAIPSLQLGQLLSVQSQVADAKSQFTRALANRQQAALELNRASGILVQPMGYGLENPGNHGCLAIFRQYSEANQHYQHDADQLAKNVATVARRPLGNWCDTCDGSENGKFGYPADSLEAPIYSQGTTTSHQFISNEAHGFVDNGVHNLGEAKETFVAQQARRQPASAYPLTPERVADERQPAPAPATYANRGTPSSNLQTAQGPQKTPSNTRIGQNLGQASRNPAATNRFGSIKSEVPRPSSNWNSMAVLQKQHELSGQKASQKLEPPRSLSAQAQAGAMQRYPGIQSASATPPTQNRAVPQTYTSPEYGSAARYGVAQASYQEPLETASPKKTMADRLVPNVRKIPKRSGWSKDIWEAISNR